MNNKSPAEHESLPWRPFHPQPLPKPPEEYLFDMREEPHLRAVMEIIERRSLHATRDICSITATAEILMRHAGTLDAYLDLHRYLTRAVEHTPARSHETPDA